jgi:hypothetical protein
MLEVNSSPCFFKPCMEAGHLHVQLCAPCDLYCYPFHIYPHIICPWHYTRAAENS